MGKLKGKIEYLMNSDSGSGHRALAGLLYGASRIYGGAVKMRSFCYSAKIFKPRVLPCRVISVGNITAGGTGKTPMTMYMAGLLRQMGYRPAVLSRGYRGGAEKEGALVSDGFSIFADSAAAGDEPLLMACSLRGVPVLVGGSRFKSGMRAVAEFDPDVVILDDGFQHMKLHRDLDIVLMDSAKASGNGFIFPRGTLREPLSGLSRADAVVFTRSGANTRPERPAWVRPDVPVFSACHEPYLAGVFAGNDSSAVSASGFERNRDFSFMEKLRVFAFSGIAHNDEFKKTIEKHAGILCGFAGFPDHHFYGPEDIEKILKQSAGSSADLLVTTEKDFVRIAGRLPASVRMAVVGVRIAFADSEEDRFAGFIRQSLAGRIKEI